MSITIVLWLFYSSVSISQHVRMCCSGNGCHRRSEMNVQQVREVAGLPCIHFIAKSDIGQRNPAIV